MAMFSYARYKARKSSQSSQSIHYKLVSNCKGHCGYYHDSFFHVFYSQPFLFSLIQGDSDYHTNDKFLLCCITLVVISFQKMGDGKYTCLILFACMSCHTCICIHLSILYLPCCLVNQVDHICPNLVAVKSCQLHNLFSILLDVHTFE